MSQADITYNELLRFVMHNGNKRSDRTGTGTISYFGIQRRYRLTSLAPGTYVEFPLLTTKKIHWKSVVYELLWFLKGDTNTKYLVDNGVKIWNEWADENGDLGPIYGKQWRAWEGKGQPIDQIARVIETIKKDPCSRRMVVSAWNVSDLSEMALEPCHCLFQFYVEDHKLSCQLYQRSADLFLGVPFNIASYSLLTAMMAQICGLGVGQLIHTIGDAHIYMNHIDQVNEQLSRLPRNGPTVKINTRFKDINDFEFDHLTLCDYDPHPVIKAPVAVRADQ